MLQPFVRDLAPVATQVQAGELRELAHVLQPRVRDLATALQVQTGELCELSDVFQSSVRDVATENQVQAGESC